MLKSRKFLGVVLTCTLAACVGCAHVQGGTAGKPARAATPLENALVYNDSLAQANKTVAKAVIDANAQTPPLIPLEYTNKILVAQSRIADFDRQLTPLLRDASSVSANAAQIKMLLGEISTAAQGVSGDLGIKDAKTQQTVSAAIANVTNLAGLVLSTLTAGGLLQ